jgi:hypothetical protein
MIEIRDLPLVVPTIKRTLMAMWYPRLGGGFGIYVACESDELN